MSLSERTGRIIAIVAIAGIAALTLIGATPADAQQNPAFVRILVSDTSTVYLEFHGTSLRVATSIEGLKSAQWINETLPGEGANFQEITLPIPSEQLPSGVTAVKATLRRYRAIVWSSGTAPSPGMTGRLGICRADEKNSVWQYNVEVRTPAGEKAENAPTVRLPNIERLTLSVVGKPSRGTLGIGLHLTAAKSELTGVSKDGKPVLVQVAVLDASGKEVASKKGPLTDFGFS